jgi:hypothetical protein
MKNKYVFFASVIFSMITLYFLANHYEGNDSNAVLMYFVVFVIPVIILSALNVFFIMVISRIKSRGVRFLTSFLPTCICIILCQMKEITISAIDGNLVFVALTGAIALGLTNLIWAIKTINL